MENGIMVWATIVIAIGTGVAAFFSGYSAYETHKAAQSQLIKSFLDEYASDMMADALKELRNRKTQYGNDYMAELQNRRSEEPNWENSRRQVAHYFQKVAAIYDSGLINKKLARIAATEQQVEFYREVVEPLEVVVNPDYGQLTFNVLDSIYEK